MDKRKIKDEEKGTAEARAEASRQLEKAFLAGLGALSNARRTGEEAFDKLVEQGKSFRNASSGRTAELIAGVQDTIRTTAQETQSRAAGIIDQVRDAPKLDKLQSAFDSGVAGALERMGVASRKSVDELNEKLDRILHTLEKEKSASRAASPAAAKKAAARGSRKRKASKKKVSKKR